MIINVRFISIFPFFTCLGYFDAARVFDSCSKLYNTYHYGRTQNKPYAERQFFFTINVVTSVLPNNDGGKHT